MFCFHASYPTRLWGVPKPQCVVVDECAWRTKATPCRKLLRQGSDRPPCDPPRKPKYLHGMPLVTLAKGPQNFVECLSGSSLAYVGPCWLLGVGLANPEFRTIPMTDLPGLRSPERPPCDLPKTFTNLRDKSCLERHSPC